MTFLLPGFIFGGAMIGFVLGRLGYLNLDVGFRAGAAPGEYYWVKQKVYRGIFPPYSQRNTLV